MTKKEIMADMNFRQSCTYYGLDWDDFEIYEDVIILNTPNEFVYVLLDKNYNTIAIHKVELDNLYLTKNELAKKYIEIYNSTYDYHGPYFQYPFEEFSLKQLVDLSNRIHGDSSNHGHSYNMSVNYELVIGENNQTYVALLSYIKFLGDMIKEYFLNSYQMKILGFEYPDIYTYINSIMYNIDKCIEENTKKNRRPFPVDLIYCIGKNNKNIDEYNHNLYNVIDLLLTEKGYKIQSGLENYNKVEATKNKPEDLTLLSTKLLTLLEVTDEELKERLDYLHKTYDMKCIDLATWIEETEKKKKIKSKQL